MTLKVSGGDSWEIDKNLWYFLCHGFEYVVITEIKLILTIHKSNIGCKCQLEATDCQLVNLRNQGWQPKLKRKQQEIEADFALGLD